MSKKQYVRRKAIHHFLRQKRYAKDQWLCCNVEYQSLEEISRHAVSCHALEIQQCEEEVQQRKNKCESDSQYNGSDVLRSRRAVKGASDPIVVSCTCDKDASLVILFYRYHPIDDAHQYAETYLDICNQLNLTGKVRVAQEGINATLAGSAKDIEHYLNWITTTPVLASLQLAQSDDPSLDSRRYQFFKPSRGCRHVFADLSVKLVDEICPLGQSSVTLDALQDPSHRQGKLSPAEFDEFLRESRSDVVLLDTRNYYESRIGHFKGAVTPAIRKFSRFPDYIDRNRESLESKTVVTYCTGGIRCEKATAYMREALSKDTTILMLDGGIHNYIEWWNKNREEDPLWQGKNYVFDARQALGINNSSVVSKCQGCDRFWDRYQKCSTKGCTVAKIAMAINEAMMASAPAKGNGGWKN
ncbi:thiosulfate sulfurtransferase (rhodanese)-like domain-containing protein 2 [Apophysomyces sp. BC1034]|nr:thiosulfate sulfurtransferase (rhodanese)-like domain-containing protein 2 [Apophysomyces sp. BC1034]